MLEAPVRGGWTAPARGGRGARGRAHASRGGRGRPSGGTGWGGRGGARWASQDSRSDQHRPAQLQWHQQLVPMHQDQHPHQQHPHPHVQQQLQLVYQQAAPPPVGLYGQPMAPGDAAAWVRRGAQETHTHPARSSHVGQHQAHYMYAASGNPSWPPPHSSGGGWPQPAASYHAASWHRSREFVPAGASGATGAVESLTGDASGGFSPEGASFSPGSIIVVQYSGATSPRFFRLI